MAAERQTTPMERERVRVYSGERVRAAGATFRWGWQGQQSSPACSGWVGSSDGSHRGVTLSPVPSAQEKQHPPNLHS